MRLTCPNCRAMYEIPGAGIPRTGRDVECSNCGHTWFQTHPDHPSAPLLRRPLAKGVSRVLREEAERERQARAKESLGAPAKPQGGKVEPVVRRKRRADIRVGPEKRAEDTFVRVGSRLSPQSEASGGFRRGLTYAVLLAGVAIAPYVLAPWLIEVLPAIKGPLNRYVDMIDQVRGMLQANLGGLPDILKGWID